MTLLPLVADIARWIVLAAGLLAFVRLVLGPSTADRAVVLDLLSVLTAAFAGLTAISSDLEAYLDVAASLALVGFLATLAFARHIERRGRLESAGADSVEDGA